MLRQPPRSNLPRGAASAAALTCMLAAAVGLAAGAMVGAQPAAQSSADGMNHRPVAAQLFAGVTDHRAAVMQSPDDSLSAASPLTTTTPSATPTRTPTSTPYGPTVTPDGAGRPNLVPVSGQWREPGQGSQSGCAGPLGPPGGLLLCVVNDGEVPAGPFALAADSAPGVPLATASGLLAGEKLCLVLQIGAGLGVVVDPAGAVAESSEDDNWLPPVPQPSGGEPRPTCMPTRTPGPGTPTAEPGPAPDLTGFGWIWMDLPWGCWRSGDPQDWRSQLLVANDGNADAGAFRIAHQDDGTSVWDVPDLPAGAVRERDALQSGRPLAIDADNAVREQDEGNNAIWIPVSTPPPTCTPGPSPTPLPRPDVVVERAEVRAMGFDEVCVPELRGVQVYIRVANHGTGFAEGILVEADGYRPGWQIRRLRPGESVDLQPVDPPVNWVRARPLALDDPANNARHVPQVTLTPPPTCTPWVSPTPTPASPTPTSTVTPGARVFLPVARNG
jgi:hypothetical protein